MGEASEVTSAPAVLDPIKVKTYVQTDGKAVPTKAVVFLQAMSPREGSAYRIVVGPGGRATEVSQFGGRTLPAGTELSVLGDNTYGAFWVAAGKDSLFTRDEIFLALRDAANQVRPTKPDLKAQRFRVPKSLGTVDVRLAEPADGSKHKFDGESPGVLRMTCKATGTKLPKGIGDRIRWSIAANPNDPDSLDLGDKTEIRWVAPGTDTDQSWPGDPTRGRGASVELKLVGLPARNGEFGSKALVMEVPDLGIRETRTVKLFFLPNSSNNPKGKSPNWFFYYQQTPAKNKHVEIGRFPDPRRNPAGWTPGMTHWRGYRRNADVKNDHPKTRIMINANLMSDPKFLNYASYGEGQTLNPGLTLYARTVKHESRHTWQIGRCDEHFWLFNNKASNALGWSFNVHLRDDGFNHYMSSTFANAPLDEDNDDWPDGLKSEIHANAPISEGPLEKDAWNFAKDVVRDSYAKWDWSAPGDQWPDA